MFDNIPVDDFYGRVVGPRPQSLTGSNQALCVVLLFGSAGAAVDYPHGQWRQGGVEPGQLG
ncbi:MAG: hypothetical protein ACRDS0_05875 [Pseudonocardiaceae bacterium]